LYKLTKVLKLETLSLLSKTGEFIYVLISAEEDLLKDWAEKTEYQLQLEIGESDPLSLEPCDYKWRPFRLSNSNTKPGIIVGKEKELEILFAKIYKRDVDYVSDLHPYEHADVPKRQWQAYECYLDFLIFNKIQILKILDISSDLNGLMIKRIFDMAFQYSYKKTSIKLNSLWKYFKLEEGIGAYSDYFRNDDNQNLDDAISIYIIYTFLRIIIIKIIKLFFI